MKIAPPPGAEKFVTVKAFEPETPSSPGNGADPGYMPPGEAAPNPIKLYSYAEMVSLPPTDWLMEGLVPRRSKSVLFGQSDTFKSFIAVDMACSVATGHTWHGKPVKRCKVIYVANEGAIGVGRKRIPAWMVYHNIPPEDRQNIFLVKVETILPNEESRSNLIKAIRTIVEPGEDVFLIMDVLRGTMTGSESDDEAAHAWTRAAEILIAELATILTLTHSPYSTDERASGSSHLWGSFDTRLQVVGDKEKMTAVLKVNRHKDHDSRGEWGFQLVEQEIPEHPGETSLVPRLDGEVKSTKRKKLPDSAAAALSALRYALDEVGAVPPASYHIPANTKCVTLKQWREYAAMRSGLDNPDSKRKAFDRGCERLSSEKTVAIWCGYAWLV